MKIPWTLVLQIGLGLITLLVRNTDKRQKALDEFTGWVKTQQGVGADIASSVDSVNDQLDALKKSDKK